MPCWLQTRLYLIAMWSALVEEDGSGISVDAMLVANALVDRTIHRSKMHRTPYQCAGLNKNTVCHVNTHMRKTAWYLSVALQGLNVLSDAMVN
jgi:hypothetical protein